MSRHLDPNVQITPEARTAAIEEWNKIPTPIVDTLGITSVVVDPLHYTSGTRMQLADQQRFLDRRFHIIAEFKKKGVNLDGFWMGYKPENAAALYTNLVRLEKALSINPRASTKTAIHSFYQLMQRKQREQAQYGDLLGLNKQEPDLLTLPSREEKIKAREEELKGVFGGRNRKTRKTRRSKKSRKTRKSRK
jgi:hypothetical protein